MNDQYRHLVIEVAVNRLVLRAMLVSLFVSSGDQGPRLAKAVLAAAEAMAPQALRLEGFDTETEIATTDLLWKRTMAVLAEFTNPNGHSDSDIAKARGTV